MVVVWFGLLQSLGPDESSCFTSSMRPSIGVKQSVDFTVIELTGTDRPGLLSELCAVLMDLQCNVVNAEIWTHRAKAAAVLQVTDEETCCAITDPERLSKIRKLLGYVLTGGSSSRRFREPKTTVSSSLNETYTDRKLHQMMFADRDYDEWENNVDDEDKSGRVVPDVDVSNLHDLDYSIVMIKCKDRPKLLFDTVFTLTDMKYVVSHASIDAEGPEAYQVYIHTLLALDFDPHTYCLLYRCLKSRVFAGILHKTYRWISSQIRSRKTTSDQMSESSNPKKSL